MRYTKNFGLRRGPLQDACFAAVLSPVVGDDWRDKNGKAKRNATLEAINHVGDLWQARVKELHEGGHPWFRTPAHVGYAQRCPPFGVWNERTLRTCRLRPFCPFCHARRVVADAYRRLKACRRPGTAAAALWTVIGLRSSLPDGPEAVRDVTRRFLSGMAPDRRDEVRRFGAYAAVVTHRLELKDSDLIATQATVLLTPYRLDDFPGCRYKAADCEPASLSEAVGQAFKYPASMLTCPADDAAALTATLGKRRLTSTYGEARRKRKVIPVDKVSD